MKTNVPKSAAGGHKKIIIIALAAIVLVAIVAAVIFSLSGKKKSENNANTNTIADETQSGESESKETGAAQTESTGEADATITALIKEYRTAFATADINALKTLYNTDQVMNSDIITATAKIITGYENTKCYVKDGMDDTSKVVFIYDDFKIADIDTLIPNVSYVYLKQKADGSYYIYPGEYDQSTANYVYSSEIQKYISELIKEDDIKALYTSVNEKFSKIVAEDPKVKAFVDKLTGNAADETKETGETKSAETSGQDGQTQAPQTDATDATDATSQTDVN